MLRRVLFLVAPLLLAACAESAATGYPPGSPVQFVSPAAADDGQPIVSHTPESAPPAPVAAVVRVSF